jgi:hypothetical protein
MPRKVFVAGEILTAADVNTNLMDQAVMSFAGTAARGSAIPSPVEGMVSYLSDQDLVTIYDGSAWKNSLGVTGGILRVVQTVNTTPVTTTSTTYVNASGIAVTITPSSTSSKVLLTAALTVENTENRIIDLHWTATAGASPIGLTRIAAQNAGVTQKTGAYAVSVLHSPSSTSAVTYQLQWKVNFATTQTISVANTVSTITAMEVAA